MARRHQQYPRRRPNKALPALAAVAAVALAAAAVATSLPGAAAAVTCDKTLAGTPANQDAVVDWTKTCNEARNWECKDACDLWNDVSRPALQKSAKFAYSGGKSYRGKILPSQPVTGIESIVNGKSYDDADKATFFLWKQALADIAQPAGKIPGVTQAAKTPVVYINSLTARTRHQFHAHVGQPQNKDLFDCVKSVFNSPPPPPTPVLNWSPVVSGGACDNLKAGPNSQVKLIATTAGPNDVNRAIRTGFAKVMTTTGKITTDPAGIRAGVLVTPLKNTQNFLVFIVTGTNDYKVFGDKP